MSGAVEGGAGTSVDAEIAGQKLRVTGASVNLIITLLGCIAAIVTAVLVWGHIQEAREAGREFVQAVKEQTAVQREQTAVMREQTCVMSQKDAEWCRRFSR